MVDKLDSLMEEVSDMLKDAADEAFVDPTLDAAPEVKVDEVDNKDNIQSSPPVETPPAQKVATGMTDEEWNERLDGLNRTVEDQDRIITELRNEVNAAASVRYLPATPAAAPAPVPVPAPVPAPPQPVVPASGDEGILFMTQEEADMLLDQPSVLNKAFGRLYAAARKDAAQEILTQLPGTISRSVKNEIAMARQVEQFFTTNKDLVPYADFVSVVGRQIEDAHPEKLSDTRWLLEETAKVARQRLKLAGATEQQNTPPDGESAAAGIPSSVTQSPGGAPAFAGARGGVRSKPAQPTGLEKEIAELMS